MKMQITRRYALTAALSSIGASTIAALSPAMAQQGYPNRPIKLVLGFAPGGTTDFLARRLGEQLAKQMGQPVIVENRPGASGNIGAAHVARSNPDGYTLLYGTNTTHAMNVSLYAKLEFDPVKDFEPIVLQGKTSNVLCVRPDFPSHTLGEFIDKARAEPGRITVASGGNATSLHMAIELLKESTGVDLLHVPYKGSSAALTDLVGGQVNAIMDNVPSSLPFIKSGRVRALAVTALSRLPQLPDVPTFNELGMKGFEVVGWGAFWAPAGTPRPIIERLNREINLALKDAQVLALMQDSATLPQGGTAEELARYAREETVKWAAIIRRAGIRLD